MYVHVCVCMCRYSLLCACMCMYVVHICMYCMYWPTVALKPPPQPQNTFSGPSSVGLTQGTPGHVPIHFLPPSWSHPPTRFCATPSCHMRPGPLLLSSGGTWERSPQLCLLRARRSCLKPCHSRSGMVAPPAHGWAQPPPSLKESSRP
jgi:hypothetical protein